MKKWFLFCPKYWFLCSLFTAAAVVFSLSLFAQTSYTKQWEKSFGGKGNDFLWDVKATFDGGVIMGGSSNSGIEGGKNQPNNNFYEDIWVIKLDALGNKQWDKTIGGTYGDEPRKLHQTADGGYILFGESWSDVSGDKSEPCRGRPDFWIVKLDANGNKVWDRTFGGSSDEIPRELEITPDGGFILTGESYSGKSGDKSRGTGIKDYWIVKVDSKGNKLWDTALELKHRSEIRYFNQTSDKGFLLSGFYLPRLQAKSGQDSTGRTDFWLIKLDENGKEVWNKHYGTEKYDFLMSVNQTSDGGYILGGNTELRNVENENSACLIIKLDRNGNKIWEKTIGTTLDEKFRTIQQTPDKGFILAGYSGQKVEGSMDIYESWLAEYYWVIKLDENGKRLWEEKFQSPRDQLGYLLQMPDNSFLLTGSYSRKDESQSEEDMFNGAPPKYINESWVTKLDPMGKKVWSTRIRRKEHHTYDTPALTKDGGFILWGQEIPKQHEADYWIAKFGLAGNKK